MTTENEYDIGTIYTTGFGPLNSNLKFARTMKQGDPDLCSPMIFSATVPIPVWGIYALIGMGR